MAKDIRVRYAPSPTGLHQNAHTVFLLMHATMVEPLSSVSRTTDRKRHVEDENVHSLKTFVGWGMDPG